MVTACCTRVRPQPELVPRARDASFDFSPECEFHHTGYEAFVVKSSGSSLLAPAAHTVNFSICAEPESGAVFRLSVGPLRTGDWLLAPRRCAARPSSDISSLGFSAVNVDLENGP